MVGSPAGRLERLAEVCAAADARAAPGAASAGARYNAGARRAAGALVLFLGPGCRVDAGLVVRHLECWRDGGKTLGAAVGTHAASAVPDQDWPVGADLSVARAVLEHAGGFDERPAFDADDAAADLCVRLRQLGRGIGGCPGTAHPRRRTLAAAWRHGRTLYRLGGGRADVRPGGPPPAASCFATLLVPCALAAVLWGRPAALLAWLAGLGASVLLGALLRTRHPARLGARLEDRALALARDLGYSAEGLRAGDLAAPWSRPLLSPSAVEAALAEARRDWAALVGSVSLVLLLLVAVGR